MSRPTRATHTSHLTATPLALAALVALSMSCASTRPVELLPKMAETPPDYAAACVGDAETKPGPRACIVSFETAARLGQRARAGQLLMLAAPEADEADQRAIAALALWLNPRVYAPDAVKRLVPNGFEVSDGVVPLGKTGPRGILVFEGVDPEAVGPGAVAVGLPLPAGATRARVAAAIAAATRGDAAVLLSDGRPVITPATPHLNTLLGGAFAPLPLSDQSRAWASALSGADRALAKGDALDAWRRVGRALDVLKDDAPICTTLGMTQLARWETASLASADIDTDPITEGCLEAKGLDGEEALAQSFLRELVFLRTKATAHGDESQLDDALYDPEKRAAYGASVDALAQKLTAPRGVFLQTLKNDMLLGHEAPEGPCDEAFASRQAAAKRENAAGYAKAGRHDYDARFRATHLLDDTRKLDVKALRALMVWLQRSDRAWLQKLAYTSALSSLTFATRPPNADAAVAELCRTTIDLVSAEVKADRGDGVSERNASRLMEAVGSAFVCNNTERLTALTDAVLDAGLESEDGNVAVLSTLMHASWQIVGALLGGRGASANASIQLLRNSIVRVKRKLTQSPEDRTLEAALSLIIVGLDNLIGGGSGPQDFVAELERVVDVLGEISATPAKLESPMTLKLAPAFHIAALSLLAVVTSDEGAREGTLETLETTIDPHINTLAGNFEVPEHADAIIRIVRAGKTFYQRYEADSGKIDPLIFEHAKAALEPSRAETGWWRVALEAARIIGWDLLAFIAHQEGLEKEFKDATKQADGLINRFTTAAIKDFELEGSSWELISMLPALQRAVFILVTDEAEGAPLYRKVASFVDEAVDEGLKRISPELRAAPAKEVGFIAVLIDMLEIARSFGADSLAAEDGSGLERWATTLIERSADYPPHLRFFIDLLSAVLLAETDKKAALDEIDKVEGIEKAPQTRRVDYAPQLFRASILKDDKATPHEETLKAIDAVLAYAKEAEGCGAFHEVHGALPFKAYTLERMGRAVEADAELARYIALIDKGFSGDGLFQCKVVSYRPNFTFNLQIGQHVGAVLFKVNAEGEFNVGAGFETHNRDHNRMICEGAPLAATRLDLELNARLMRAAYRLRDGADDKATHQALVEASASVMRLLNGNNFTVPPKVAAGLEESRKKAHASLMLWVAAMAFVEGHVGPANVLRNAARQIVKSREGDTIEQLVTGDIPPQLADLGLDGLRPVVRAYATASRPEDEALAEALKKFARANPKRLDPKLAPLLSTHERWRLSRTPIDKKVLKKLKPGKDDATKRLRATIGFIDTASLETASLDMEALEKHLVLTIAQGQHSDVQDLAQNIAERLFRQRKLADAMKVLWMAIDRMPGARAPIIKAELLLWLSNFDPNVTRTPRWINTMAPLLDAVHGYINVELELRALQIVTTGLAVQRRFDAMQAPVTNLRDIAVAAFGVEHPLTLNVQIMAAALDAYYMKPDMDEIARINVNAKRAKGLEPALKNLIQFMARDCDDKDKCKSYAETFLTSFGQ